MTDACTNIKNLSLFGNEYISLIIEKTRNNFWKDVFSSLINLNKQSHIHHLINFVKYPLWYSEHIKIDNKTIYLKGWIHKEIYTIRDIIHKNKKTTMTYTDLDKKFNFKPNFVEYLGIKKHRTI